MKEIAKPRPWPCVGEPGLNAIRVLSPSAGLKVFVFGQARSVQIVLKRQTLPVRPAVGPVGLRRLHAIGEGAVCPLCPGQASGAVLLAPRALQRVPTPGTNDYYLEAFDGVE